MYIAMSVPHQLASQEFHSVGLLTYNVSTLHRYMVASHFYRFSKLQWPYVDNCVNYEIFGYRNKLDALNDCNNKKRNEEVRRAYRMKIFTENDSSIFPLERSKPTLYGECEAMYSQPDCYTEELYSEVAIHFPNLTMSKIITVPNTKMSYVNENSPKIAHVDYVTYIFGAAGTWFGFSFLVLNPVNFLKLSQVAGNKVEEGNEAIEERVDRKELAENLTQLQNVVKKNEAKILELLASDNKLRKRSI